MTSIQTREQRRAQAAWNAVQARTEAGVTRIASWDYRQEAKRLPVRIRASGLGHALAFANAKGQEGKCVADDVAVWVLNVLNREHTEKDAAGQLMQQVIKNDTDWLRQATEEALAYLRWLCRFAEAKAPDEAPDRFRK